MAAPMVDQGRPLYQEAHHNTVASVRDTMRQPGLVVSLQELSMDVFRFQYSGWQPEA